MNIYPKTPGLTDSLALLYMGGRIHMRNSLHRSIDPLTRQFDLLAWR